MFVNLHESHLKCQAMEVFDFLPTSFVVESFQILFHGKFQWFNENCLYRFEDLEFFDFSTYSWSISNAATFSPETRVFS